MKEERNTYMRNTRGRKRGRKNFNITMKYTIFAAGRKFEINMGFRRRGTTRKTRIRTRICLRRSRKTTA